VSCAIVDRVQFRCLTTRYSLRSGTSQPKACSSSRPCCLRFRSFRLRSIQPQATPPLALRMAQSRSFRSTRALRASTRRSTSRLSCDSGRDRSRYSYGCGVFPSIRIPLTRLRLFFSARRRSKTYYESRPTSLARCRRGHVATAPMRRRKSKLSLSRLRLAPATATLPNAVARSRMAQTTPQRLRVPCSRCGICVSTRSTRNLLPPVDQLSMPTENTSCSTASSSSCLLRPHTSLP
jgi:hypothetical protein